MFDEQFEHYLVVDGEGFGTDIHERHFSLGAGRPSGLVPVAHPQRACFENSCSISAYCGGPMGVSRQARRCTTPSASSIYALPTTCPRSLIACTVWIFGQIDPFLSID